MNHNIKERLDSELNGIINGGFDSIYLIAQKLVDNVYTLKEGELSEVFDTSDGYAFVYLEKVDHELSETDEARLNNEIANAYIGQNAQMRFNKTLIKQIDLNTLIPKNSKVEDTTENQDVNTDIENVVDDTEGNTETVETNVESTEDNTDNVVELFSNEEDN